MSTLRPQFTNNRRRPPITERRAQGRRIRKLTCRSSHAQLLISPTRADPIALLASSDKHRLPRLVPIRYGRMLVDPLAFLRGASAVMASDLANTPATGLRPQICGDAHLNNFGMFATPERRLAFDLNDFDETAIGPWEWDIKRLAASVVVAGRVAGVTDDWCREAAIRCAASYRKHMRRFAK